MPNAIYLINGVPKKPKKGSVLQNIESLADTAKVFANQEYEKNHDSKIAINNYMQKDTSGKTIVFVHYKQIEGQTPDAPRVYFHAQLENLATEYGCKEIIGIVLDDFRLAGNAASSYKLTQDNEHRFKNQDIAGTFKTYMLGEGIAVDTIQFRNGKNIYVIIAMDGDYSLRVRHDFRKHAGRFRDISSIKHIDSQCGMYSIEHMIADALLDQG